MHPSVFWSLGPVMMMWGGWGLWLAIGRDGKGIDMRAKR